MDATNNFKTTVKGNVSVSSKDGELIEIGYKRYSLFLATLTMISLTISLSLCAIVIGVFLLPIPMILVPLFYLVQVRDNLFIQKDQGLILKNHNIAFKDVTSYEMKSASGVAKITALVKGKNVVVARLLKPSVAHEIIALITN